VHAPRTSAQHARAHTSDHGRDESRQRIAAVLVLSTMLCACASMLRACASMLRACASMLRACASMLRACATIQCCRNRGRERVGPPVRSVPHHAAIRRVPRASTSVQRVAILGLHDTSLCPLPHQRTWRTWEMAQGGVPTGRTKEASTPRSSTSQGEERLRNRLGARGSSLLLAWWRPRAGARRIGCPRRGR